MASKRNFIFFTDYYHADSIRAQERLCRGFSQTYTSSMAWPLEGLRTSSYSWPMKKTSDSSVGYCSGSVGEHGVATRLEKCGTAGKVTPLKKLQKNPKYQKASRQLGDDWTVKPEVADVETFTCLMYGHARETSVDVVRGKMLPKMVGKDEKLTIESKVDLAHLPPCKNNLFPSSCWSCQLPTCHLQMGQPATLLATQTLR